MPDDEQPEPLGLADRAGADRHLRAISALEAELAIEVHGALEQITELREWIAEREAKIGSEIAWHRDVLERYHEAVRAITPRLKTIKLPHGELRSRAQQSEWVVDDDFLPWAQANLEAVVRPPTPGEPTIDRAAMKRLLTPAEPGDDGVSVAVTPDGVVADGVVVVHRPDQYTAIPQQKEPDE